MLSVQLAKDTFYANLRDRVAAGNTARTVVIRGCTAPRCCGRRKRTARAAVDGIAPADAFCLRWTALRIDPRGGLPLITMTCEIRYATDGTSGLGGMDRGRALAEMDAELVTAISTTPQSTGLVAIAEIPGGGASTQSATGTNVFWGDVSFKPAVLRGERMERTAEVEVFSYGQ